MLKLLLFLILKLVSGQQDDWWYDQGNDWGTSDYFSAINPFYQTYKHVAAQMDMYGYAKHVGKINRGKFSNPELNLPANRAHGYQSDFNPKDYHSGAFRHQPKGQRYIAKPAHVNAGLASHVGEILKMPVGQHVQGDGTVLVQVDGRQADPCLPNPCTYSNLPRCEVVNAGTVKCSRSESFKLTLAWVDPADDGTKNDLDLTIVASLHDGSFCALMSYEYTECGVEVSDDDEGEDFPDREMETAEFKTLDDGSSWHNYTYAILAYYYDYNLSEGSPMLIVTDDHGDSVQVLTVPQFDEVTNLNNEWRKYFFFGCFRSPLGEVDIKGAGFYDEDIEVLNTGLTVLDAGLCKALMESPSHPGFTPYPQATPFRDETRSACLGFSWNCCTPEVPCPYAGGGCRSDSSCEGDLVCGYNNCQDFFSGAPKHNDCCVTSAEL